MSVSSMSLVLGERLCGQCSMSSDLPSQHADGNCSANQSSATCHSSLGNTASTRARGEKQSGRPQLHDDSPQRTSAK